MKYIKCAYIFIFGLSLLCRIEAQETKVIRDFRLITEVGVEKKLLRSWKVSFETILKLERNASRLDEMDFDLDVEYKPIRYVSLGTGYRFAMNKNTDGNIVPKHRYMGNINLEYDIKRFELEYRFRYQNIDDDFFLYENMNAPKNILRNRLRIKYDIPRSKLTPYLFSELYGNLDKNKPFAFKIKSGIGARYNLKRFGQLKLYYRIDRELNAPHPFTYFILGAGYSYDF